MTDPGPTMRGNNVGTMTVTAPKVAFPFSFMSGTVVPTGPPRGTVDASCVMKRMHTDGSSYASSGKIDRGWVISMVALGAITAGWLFERHFGDSGSFYPVTDPAPVVNPVDKSVGVTPVVATMRFAFGPGRTVGVTGVEVRGLIPLGSAPLQVLSAVGTSLSLSLHGSECSPGGYFVWNAFFGSFFESLVTVSLYVNLWRMSTTEKDPFSRCVPRAVAAMVCRRPAAEVCFR